MRNGDCAFTESVAEPPPDDGQMPHATGAGGVAPLGLLAPVVAAGLGPGEAAGRADFLLDVHAHAAAATAQRVRLVATFTK